MLFSSDWRTVFVVLSLLKFSAIDCDPWSQNGTVSSVYAVKNRRLRMEDTFIRIEGVSGYGIFGVFDGHGGDQASTFAASFLPRKIQNETEQFLSTVTCSLCILRPELSYERVLTIAINEAEARLKKEFVERQQRSGTTCLLVIAEEKKLTVANLGDSRAVMCAINGSAIALSTDHKPNNADERQRIERAGGELHQIDEHGVWRVNGLAMSRSLGDHCIDLEKKFISGVPDIATYDLDKYRPKFMILASDGIWDVISNQDAVDFIKVRYENEDDFGASALVAHAMDNPEAPHLRSNDNITVVIVVFNKHGHYRVGSAKA